MSQASALEQEMLALVNAERAKVGVDPLTFDDNLNSAAEDHSSWMLENDIFDHTGVDGTEPEDRAVDAGYVLEGRSAVGENIGWHSTGGEPGLSDDVVLVHEGLMNSPAHKAAILNPLFTEIGIGVENGDFFIDGRDWDSVMVTQNFGTTEAEDSPPAEPEVEETPVAPDDIATVEETETPEDVMPEADEESVAAAETTDDEQPEDMTGDDVTHQPTETSEDETPEADEESVAATETTDDEQPQDMTGDDAAQEPTETSETSEDETPEADEEIIAATETTDDEQPQDMTGDDAGTFDFGDLLNLDFLDDLFAELENLFTGLEDLFAANGNNNGNGNTGDGINGQGNGLGNNGTGENGTGNGNGNSDWWDDQVALTEAAAEPDTADTASSDSTDASSEALDFANLGDIPEPELPFDDCFIM
ncbi:MAG: CAP domain-containing protein, partial [Sneathiella sp.]